ncbi:MAG: hypothetical protein FWG39_02690, partial [Alphaproteobacteria bacterium]|nr:hypothetical protein [Alphaproteobacteria bacterium]
LCSVLYALCSLCVLCTQSANAQETRAVVARAAPAVSAPVAAEPVVAAVAVQPVSRIVPGTRSASSAANIPAAAPVAEPEPEPEKEIETFTPMKSFFNRGGVSGGGGDSMDGLARNLINIQLENLRTQEREQNQIRMDNSMAAATTSSCDDSLRKCMADKCGENFKNCAGDGDSIWGFNIESCARAANCAPREITLFSAEIKADRDHNARWGAVSETYSCGNNYNDCILRACGGRGIPNGGTSVSASVMGLPYCISKTGGDNAIANARCRAIAEQCGDTDSGLAARALEIFGTLRILAERDLATQEQQLYGMREDLRKECRNTGGILDDRSLQCLFNVEMFAGGDWSGMIASRIIGAGAEFQCTPEWFGIDVTTHMENMARYDSQTAAATGAFSGAMLGVAGGMLASGEVYRGLKAEHTWPKSLIRNICKLFTSKEKESKRCLNEIEEKIIGPEVPVNPAGEPVIPEESVICPKPTRPCEPMPNNVQSGNQSCLRNPENSWSDCIISTCVSGYYESGNECIECPKEGDNLPADCKCTPNTPATNSPLPTGKPGVLTQICMCNSTGTGFSECTDDTCNHSFYKSPVKYPGKCTMCPRAKNSIGCEPHECKENQSCSTKNIKTGTQTCDTQDGVWKNTCAATECNPGFCMGGDGNQQCKEKTGSPGGKTPC